MFKAKLLLVSFFAVFALTGCGDGVYRYPCQDPKNWETAECKPPICEVNGYCPVDLVGEDIFNGTSSKKQVVSDEDKEKEKVITNE